MVKKFDCNSCGCHHPRPINRNCNVSKDNQDVSVDVNAQILQELKSLNAKMTTMESKVHSLDEQRSPARSSRRMKNSFFSPACILPDEFKIKLMTESRNCR